MATSETKSFEPCALIDWGDTPVETKLQINRIVDKVAEAINEGFKAGITVGTKLVANVAPRSVGVSVSTRYGPWAGKAAESAARASCLVIKPKIEEAGHRSIETSVQFTAKKTKEGLHQSIDFLTGDTSEETELQIGDTATKTKNGSHRSIDFLTGDYWGDTPVEAELQINQTVDRAAETVKEGLKTGVTVGTELVANVAPRSVGVSISTRYGSLVGKATESAARASCLVIKPKIEEAGHRSIETSIQFTAEKTKEGLHRSINFVRRT